MLLPTPRGPVVERLAGPEAPGQYAQAGPQGTEVIERLVPAAAERLRPGVVAIPFGWWSRHHPDGRIANSLTNDTLTEWGGGVAYSDTLVQVAPADA